MSECVFLCVRNMRTKDCFPESAKMQVRRSVHR